MWLPTLPDAGTQVLARDPAELQQQDQDLRKITRDPARLAQLKKNQPDSGPSSLLWSRPWYTFLDALIMALRGPTITPQSQIAGLALKFNLGVKDAGKQIYVPVYNHTLEWTGAAWTWAPDTEISNWYTSFDPAGPLPGVGSGWVLANGATVNVLKPDGSLASVTIATVANAHYRI